MSQQTPSNLREQYGKSFKKNLKKLTNIYSYFWNKIGYELNKLWNKRCARKHHIWNEISLVVIVPGDSITRDQVLYCVTLPGGSRRREHVLCCPTHASLSLSVNLYFSCAPSNEIPRIRFDLPVPSNSCGPQTPPT